MIQKPNHYKQVAEIIDYLKNNFNPHPLPEELAEHLNLSLFQLKHLFTEWAGTSPEKFLQYISIPYAKELLRDKSQPTLFNTTSHTVHSGTGKQHNLFITIEGMTPAEYRNGGQALKIHFQVAESPFGSLLVASTTRGICYMTFSDDKKEAVEGLKKLFPNASITEQTGEQQHNALAIFLENESALHQIILHLKGTPFQLKIWETLLKIPTGQLISYKQLAERAGQPNASRAVGTAIGNNPVAYLVPCHRIIRSTGESGEYMWNSTRKKAIIAWEAAKTAHLRFT